MQFEILGLETLTLIGTIFLKSIPFAGKIFLVIILLTGAVFLNTCICGTWKACIALRWRGKWKRSLRGTGIIPALYGNEIGKETIYMGRTILAKNHTFNGDRNLKNSTIIKGVTCTISYLYIQSAQPHPSPEQNIGNCDYYNDLWASS